MKIAIYRKDLIDALSRVSKVVPSVKVSPILTYVLVSADGDFLSMTGTDLSNFISVTVPCKTAESGVALVPAVDFLSALKTLNKDAVLVTFDNNLLKLRSGPTGWNWKTLDPATFPQVPQWEPSRVFVVDKDKFVSAARKVKNAAAVSSFSVNLEQVGFSNGTLQAADGARFHQVKIDDDLPLTMALPLPFIDDLINILPMLNSPDFEIGTNEAEDSIVVQCSDVVISTKTKTDKFPDLNKAFLIPAMANYSFVKVDKSEFLSAVKRVRIVSDKNSRSISLQLDGTSSMTLNSQQPNGSFASDSIAVECDPQTRTIILNVDHLVQGVNVFDDEVIEFKLGTDTKSKPSTVFINQSNRAVVLNQLRVL